MKRTMSHEQLSRVFAVCTVLLAPACWAAQPMFSVQILRKIPGATASAVYGINNAGQAVGTISGSSSVCPNACVVIWNGISPTLLGTVPGASGYGPLSINNLGQVAGTAQYGVSGTKAAVWVDGTPTLLPLPAGESFASSATSINDKGQIAGSVQAENTFDNKATVWNDSVPTLLDTPPCCGTDSSANAINDMGLAVGYVTTPGFLLNPAAVWHGASVKMLPEGTDGDLSGGAFAVNDDGLVVGEASTTFPAYEAAAWSGGELVYLGVLPSGFDSWATAVNAQGVIVGWSSVSEDSSEIHAVLWGGIGAGIQDLNDLINPEVAGEVVLSEATGINNHCAIVADGYVQKPHVQYPVAVLLTLNDPSRCHKGL